MNAEEELRERVRNVVERYLTEKDRSALKDLDDAFDVTYDVLAVELPESTSKPSTDSGLPFDAALLGDTILSGSILLSAYLLRHALELQSPQSFQAFLERRFRKLEQNDAQLAATFQRLGEITQLEAYGELHDQVPSVGTAPDLRIFVDIQRRDGKTILHYTRDEGSLVRNRSGSRELHLPPADYFKNLLGDLEDLADGDLSSEAAEWKLAAPSGKLFQDLLSDKLQERLWTLRERLVSLQVLSEETAIPWELIKLRRPGSGSGGEGPFLGESFALTRWFPGMEEVCELPLRKIGVIVVATANLPNPEAEVEMLRELGYSVTEIPARYEDVIEALRSGEYDGLHFIGHGKAQREDADRSYVELNDYHRLKPGEIPDLRTTRPFIFWNACQTAQGGISLAGAGGWAKAFLEAGAGAFVGALWSIRSSKARSFAEKLYGTFRANTPLGEAVRQARIEMKKEFPGDPSWLAYAVFGHPWAAREA